MNEADKEVHDTYMEHRDELSSDYLRDLVWDIWSEMEDRHVRPSDFTVDGETDE